MLTQAEVLDIATARLALRTGRAKRIREAAGLTQAEFASVCEVDAATFSRWESGQRIPRGGAALRLARFLSALERSVQVGVGT